MATSRDHASIFDVYSVPGAKVDRIEFITASDRAIITDEYVSLPDRKVLPYVDGGCGTVDSARFGHCQAGIKKVATADGLGCCGWLINQDLCVAGVGEPRTGNNQRNMQGETAGYERHARIPFLESRYFLI
ncbi:hypothetical protein [Pseudomonas sp. LBUM920]|uniref:hypothetical protein n=1 Tax=Pseudomonas sp. LBUM920 TaxID=2126069 RepID=UPI00211555D7|nr:hypothetical protein [Pseudomonas sp. LBUM920]